MPYSNPEDTKLMNVWYQMKARCLKPTHKVYGYYGGRGITVCPEWLVSCAAFKADMGPRPAGGTLERRDNNLGYTKDNCYWATRTEQARNTRQVKLSAEAVHVIRGLWEAKHPDVKPHRFFMVVAPLFNCGIYTLRDAIYGKTWKLS